MKFSASRLLRSESTPGILLAIAAAVAVVLSNSPAATFYNDTFATPVAVQVGTVQLAKPLLLWINEGLMAIFFLLVGLEIKREVVRGHLSTLAEAALPLGAALGGMAVPAMIYLAINATDPVARMGWAIPTATDIAFALGVLSLLGNRVPLSLKVFLTAVAVIDDLGAIVIIGLFYTADLSSGMLLAAAFAALALAIFNRAGVSNIAAYLLLGSLLWLIVVKSGVHATLAGVAVALAIPVRPQGAQQRTLDFENALRPWVAFLILPVFAFANAGISLSAITMSTLVSPVPVGIALGLIVGKFAGVLLASTVLIKSGVAKMPADASWIQLAGIAALCGIGFTMSLFIGSLAFEGQDERYATLVKLGVLTGSLVSALIGCALLISNGALRPRMPRYSFTDPVNPDT